MNILEVYIKEIYSEKEIDTEDLGKFIEVSMQTHCWGATEDKVHWFRPDEWEEVKARGYYMA